MTAKTFSSWVKTCSWVGVSSVAALGYLSQRQWFLNVTNSWFTGFFEGSCVLIAISIFVNKYGDSLAEVYFGLRELGKLRQQRAAHHSQAE